MFDREDARSGWCPCAHFIGCSRGIHPLKEIRNSELVATHGLCGFAQSVSNLTGVVSVRLESVYY